MLSFWNLGLQPEGLNREQKSSRGRLLSPFRSKNMNVAKPMKEKYGASGEQRTKFRAWDSPRRAENKGLARNY